MPHPRRPAPPSRPLARRAFRLLAAAGLFWAALPWPAVADTTRPADAAALSPGDHARSLVVDGRRRSYRVHVPPAYDPKTPTPVVLAYHGALMNAPLMAAFTGLSDKADAENFVVVYPNGVGVKETALFFNASLPRDENDAGRSVDDVRFTERLLDDLAGVVNVDARRVFATGLSNGGMMAHRVAVELSGRVAAAAPVAGTLAVVGRRPARAVPVMHFHGTADRIVPVAGPNGPVPPTMNFTSVEQTINTWRSFNECNGPPRVRTVGDTAGDGTTATVFTYGPPAAEVVYVRVDNGGHTWPGMRPPVAWIGASTGNVSANDRRWDFFRRHPMP